MKDKKKKKEKRHLKFSWTNGQSKNVNRKYLLLKTVSGYVNGK